MINDYVKKKVVNKSKKEGFQYAIVQTLSLKIFSFQ